MDVWWGSSTVNRDSIVNLMAPANWANLVLPASLLPKSSRPSPYKDYWGIQDVDEHEDMLNRAYADLDTNVYPTEARDLFVQLVSEGYTPAIKGYAVSLRRLENNPSTIEDLLLTNSPDSVDNSFANIRKVVIGSEYREQKDFETAVSRFIEYAAEAGNPLDSLLMMIEVERTNELQVFANQDWGGGGTTTQSLGGSDEQLAAIGLRIQDYNDRIASLLAAKRTGENPLPNHYSLGNAYPNPFNPTTTVPYALPKDGRVKLAIYNILGQHVATLLNESQRAGYHRVVWNGRSESGMVVGSGVYFVKMEAAGFLKTRKIVMIK